MTEYSEKILEEFKRVGQKASYHFADDSAKEWPLGNQKQKEALALFDQHPKLQADMREIAAKFLWSLKLERPVEVSHE